MCAYAHHTHIKQTLTCISNQTLQSVFSERCLCVVRPRSPIQCDATPHQAILSRPPQSVHHNSHAPALRADHIFEQSTQTKSMLAHFASNGRACREQCHANGRGNGAFMGDACRRGFFKAGPSDLDSTRTVMTVPSSMVFVFTMIGTLIGSFSQPTLISGSTY